MKPMISVRNVTKVFRFDDSSERNLKKFLIRLLKFKISSRTHEFKVLEEISFDIFPGEFVGIMGRNGAGKSTILKIISGVYSPTSGEIISRGKIAPLLELGAGFSSELSGYDNIFLNAAILGFGKQRTEKLLPEIIAFAELSEKIHLPVKKYSSGMLIRLGFSIAVHLDAPILLFDEVLGVGDVGFQEKCLKKIRELHESGRTIILVTHSPQAVVDHCTRCIVIEKSRKVFDGSAEMGGQVYLSNFS